MIGPGQTPETEASPPNLSPSSSSSSSSSRTPKAVIDNLCTHVADTTLADDNIQQNHPVFMQSQNTANQVEVSPPATHHSPPPLLPPALSFVGVPDDSPMELCESDGTGGLPLEEEECKTPRGEEYRIPEPLTCPPAPKRTRRNRLQRPVYVEKEEEEESVDSSEVEEALNRML